MQKRSSAPLCILCILLVLNGCMYLPYLTNSSGPGDTPVTGIMPRTPTAPVSSQVEATTLPEVAPLPKVSALVLSANTLHDSGEAPRYEVDARWPLLEWDGSPSVEPFNQAAERFANEQVRSFKENVYGLPEDPLFQDSFSSLNIDFVPTTDTKGIFAVLFQISFYSAGAAHPGHYSYAINYDLRTGKVLALEDLFLPGANYLAGLSDACMDDLKTRNVLEWEDGALPDPENYQVWNITSDGVLVTFDEYQVASYAAGPQSVMVPYKKIEAILRPDGPLREYLSH